jgi:hypothetical protein
VDRTVNVQSIPLFAVLPGGGLGSVDREAQLALCRVEVVLGFGAVAHHVVVIRRTCTVHLMDGFNDMFVNVVKIVPSRTCADNITPVANADVRASAERIFFIVIFSVQSMFSCRSP